MNPISYFWLRRRQDAVRKMLKKSKILDVGCGEYKIIPNAIGLDIHTYSGVDKIGRAEKLPFANDSFDTVTMLEVIEHLKNPNKALQEIKRVLKPGGQIIISTPNYSSLLWRIIWKIWSHSFGRKWLNPHTHEFNEKTIRRLLAKYFKVKRVRKVNWWIIILEGVKEK